MIGGSRSGCGRTTLAAMTEPETTPPPFLPYVPGPMPAQVPPEDLRPAVPAAPTPAGRNLRPVLFGAAGLLLGLALGVGVTFAAVGSGTDPSPVAAAAAEPTTVYVTETVVLTAAPTTPAAATTAAAPPPPPPAPTIEDGSWTVGEDIPAGTYKTVGAGSDCYWGIYKSGTNQSDIVKVNVGGGNLRVTLKAGQDFTTDRCGTWTKIG